MAQLKNTTINDTGYLLPSSGPISDRPGYAYQYFTSTGAATFSVPTGVTTVDVLVVAGGGGAGVSNGSAGGGGGGMVEVTGFPVTPGGSVPLTVGAGGAGVNTTGPGQPRGGNGQNSTFGSLTALGGGGSGSEVGNNAGAAGGSGGGGVRGSGDGGAGQQPGQPGQSGSFGYGFAGGQSAFQTTGDGPPHYGGGGGGGAGSAGVRGSTSAGTDPVSGNPWGSGGNGRLSAITGTYFAGGGGGGYYNNGSGIDYPIAGKGGIGGGGNGGLTTWRDGAVNTGGGGGSSGLLGIRGNGDGGPGIVVVRWTNPDNPTSATTGMTRYNSDGNYLEVYNGTRWVSAQKTVVAFDQPGGYNWRVPKGITAVEVLVVAGGGGGGAGYQGGGGGAGGLVYQTTYGVAPETYIPVHVGAGGIGAGLRGERLGTITAVAGENGQPSRFGELEAIGGGRGAGEIQAFQGGGSPFRATEGGSGGGGSHYQDNTPSPVESFTSGTAGQGNAGGNGYTGSPYGGGGGGGAGGAGQPASPGTPAPTRCMGGAGLAYSITGTSVVYAGGGSGSVRSEGLKPAHPSGGGGGAGFGQGAGIPGQAGTGGGGGSGGNGPGNDSPGGVGGPGIVIIRY